MISGKILAFFIPSIYQSALSMLVFHTNENEQPADGCSFSQREGISYWDCVSPQCENIGEFSQFYYSMWDTKCLA